MKHAIVPGSFDPITLGHLELIRKAADLFDQVTVAVMENAAKKATYSLSKRLAMAEKTCADLCNVRVIASQDMLVDLAKKIGAAYIVKGVRNTLDFAYEQNMAMINRELEPSIQTLYIPSDAAWETVSSSLVRELLKNGKTPERYVHPAILPYLKIQ